MCLFFFFLSCSWSVAAFKHFIHTENKIFHNNIVVGKTWAQRWAYLWLCVQSSDMHFREMFLDAHSRLQGEKHTTSGSSKQQKEVRHCEGSPLFSQQRCWSLVSNAEIILFFLNTQFSTLLQYHWKKRTKNQHFNWKTFHQMSVDWRESDEQRERLQSGL